MTGEVLFTLNGVSKSFGGIKALQNVNMKVNKGEVLSIIGENGAGKSTLMKIIAGALQSDTGKIEFEGNEVKINNTQDAIDIGISIVYQEPNVFAELSVLENLFIGEEVKTKFGSIDWPEMYRQAAEALELVDLPTYTLNEMMGDLSIGNQQLVLIARGLHRQSKLLILDEPTSILSQAESEKLFALIAELKENGVSILYISHRIPEILRISDQMIVLRDGKVTETFSANEATENRIITAMSGREINSDIYRLRDYYDEKPIIKVNNLSKSKMFHDISFSIKPGEILGVYGLVGSGRSEVARTLFGELAMDSGNIEFEGKKLTKHSTNNAVRKGIYYVPEDRGTQGNFSLHSIKYNLSAAFLPTMSNKFGVLNLNDEKKIIQKNVEKYSIKTKNMEDLIISLSGGNQQKVLLSRWLINTPRVLILDEPTRGIDIGTKTEIHELILTLAESGVAVLLISSDLPEVMRLSDRIMTFHKGRITGFTNRENMTEDGVLRKALGLIS
ncbi:sugar ABC transporter ATP-binding protein [Sporosarcina jiandibaonis]|uniref:sugar ABC transporter ATP-binding protein n=1 Tax=Sporosarcina jiandibaonis TaxID=2715535 RepID=UPI001557BFCF|nr:sugar ABC transporter ATP-binding protein [Sporosarcina jiandibaonis]